MVGNVLGVLMQVIRAKVPDMSREQFEIDYPDAIFANSTSLKNRCRVSMRTSANNLRRVTFSACQNRPITG
jgi:hypothetical protein